MKVAIIGAGITGLYLAQKLSEKGYSVTVFEKKEKIGKEVCSSLFSERILEFIPESQKLIKNQINYCLINFPKKTLKIKFPRKFFIIDHGELDRLVASLAEKSGARIVLGKNISNLPIEFERIIGCDGAISFVRKSLGLNEPSYRLGIQGFISEMNLSPFVETWPVRSGFIWKIPRGKEVEYGIMEEPKISQKVFEKFLKKNNINLKNIKSALISQGFIIPSNSKITLCGESSGLTKPWSGGGVVWSLLSAEILLKNFPNFLKYKKEMKKFFLPKIIFSELTKKTVYFFGFKFPWALPGEFKIDGDFLI